MVCWHTYDGRFLPRSSCGLKGASHLYTVFTFYFYRASDSALPHLADFSDFANSRSPAFHSGGTVKTYHYRSAVIRKQALSYYIYWAVDHQLNMGGATVYAIKNSCCISRRLFQDYPYCSRVPEVRGGAHKTWSLHPPPREKYNNAGHCSKEG